MWKAGRFTLDLARPRVMAIINLTPDSFSDGGQHEGPQAALAHAQQCLREGADILDFGAESTRPGAQALAPGQEWARLEPVLREAVNWNVPISVDTRHTEVMRRALDIGVDIVNDVQALQAPGALALLAAHPNAGVCLMHMRGEPSTMQQHTTYEDVVSEVSHWLLERLDRVQAAGVQAARIVLDVGIGFAKTPAQNLALLQRQRELVDSLPRPLLVGWSRKSTLGALIGNKPPEQRLAASLSAAVLAAQAGARVLRVHDVAPTVEALAVLQAVQPDEMRDALRSAPQ